MSARAWSLVALGSVVWAVAAGFVFGGSTAPVQFIAWGVGESLLFGLALFTDKVRGAVWVPSSQHHDQQPRDYVAEHQQHLWEQARAAYLTNPQSQQPPPTDNFPGF